jgi:hypothetical protein
MLMEACIWLDNLGIYTNNDFKTKKDQYVR